MVKKNRKSRAGRQGKPQPPQLSSNLRFSHVYRFASTNGMTATQITNATVLAALGGIVTVNATTATSMIDGYRIKRIRLWASPTAVGSANTLICSFTENTQADQFGANLEFSDTSLNVDQSCYLDVVPPQGSFAAMWQSATGINSAARNLFTIASLVPAGTAGGTVIVDLHVEMVMNDGAQVATFGSGGALGALVFGRLDGTGGVFRPQALTDA